MVLLLNFESVLVILQDVNEGLWVLDCKCKVININSNILILITILAHPDVWFSFAWCKAFLSQYITQPLMPSGSTKPEAIQCLVYEKQMVRQCSKLWSCSDAHILRC